MSVLTVFSVHIGVTFIQMMTSSTATPTLIQDTHTSVRPCPQMTEPRPLGPLRSATPLPGVNSWRIEVESEQKDADLLSDYTMLSITPGVVGSGDGRSHDGHVTGGEEAQ